VPPSTRRAPAASSRGGALESAEAEAEAVVAVAVEEEEEEEEGHCST
jgi:hypothetical protein